MAKTDSRTTTAIVAAFLTSACFALASTGDALKVAFGMEKPVLEIARKTVNPRRGL